MRKCKCGNDVANNAISCPKCGHRFTSGPVKFLAWFLGITVVVGVIGITLSQNDSRPAANTVSVPAPVPPPTRPKPGDKAAQAKAQIAARQANTKAQITVRQDYARELERSLLSRGLDAHVTVVGTGKDTLRISWAAMSRPIVYNMITSEGMETQVPLLGFKKVIFTDDGSFSGTSTESWTYRWDGQQWRQ
jgi:hypothetical protein